MNSENQTGVRYKQLIKIEKPLECSRRFLAALVKEMMAPFSCPNHGLKHSKQRRKSKFSVSQIEEENLQKLEADSVQANTKKRCVVAPWPMAKCM